MNDWGPFGTTILILVPLAAVAVLYLMWRMRARIQARLSGGRTRVVVALLAGAAALGACAPFLVQSFTWAGRRDALMGVILQANATEKEPIWQELTSEGGVTVDGMVWRSAQVKAVGERLFDPRSGKVTRPDEVVAMLLAPALPAWMPSFLLERGTVVALTVMAVALLAGAVLLDLVLLLGTVLLGGVAASCVILLVGSPGAILVVAGMGVLLTGYGVLSRVVLSLLSAPRPITAVAHTVLRESTRQWYTGAFIMVLLVVLPLVPALIEPNQPLRYRVQSFISWSLGLTLVLAALLTLVLSCATVSLEIRDRQIWQTLTKPVDRLAYLLGKWLGVSAVNLILLAVSALSIFLFVQYLRTQRGQDPLDELSVRDEVLVARVSASPAWEMLAPDVLAESVDRQLAADPNLQAEIESGMRRESDVRKQLTDQVRQEYLSKQRSISPGEFRTYRFPGVGAAKGAAETVTLKYLFHAGASDPHTRHPVIFRFKDGSWTDRIFVPAQGFVLPIPAYLIDDDGSLTVEIGNLGIQDDQFFPGQWNIYFDANGMEVLFKVGGFEANFLRALLVEWTKLAFLGMLGVCCATVLSLPVALLFSVTVYLVGTMTPFLATAIEAFSVDTNANVLVVVFQVCVRSIAVGINWLLGGYGQVSADTLLVEGRLVSWTAVGRSFLLMGVVWCGLSLLIGWTAFRRKEIAIYSGQGG